MALAIASCVFAVFLAAMVFSVVAFIDAVRRPSADWTDAGRSKVGWASLMVLFPVPFASVYWAVVRPSLNSPGEQILGQAG